MAHQATVRSSLTISPSATEGDITELQTTLDVNATHGFALTGSEIIMMTVDASNGGGNAAGKFTPAALLVTGTNLAGGVSVGQITPGGSIGAITPGGTVSQPTFTGTNTSVGLDGTAIICSGDPGEPGPAFVAVEIGAPATEPPGVALDDVTTQEIAIEGTVSQPTFTGNEVTPAFTGTPVTPTVTGSNTNVTHNGTGTDASAAGQGNVSVWFEIAGDVLTINAGYWKTNAGAGEAIRVNYTIIR